MCEHDHHLCGCACMQSTLILLPVFFDFASLSASYFTIMTYSFYVCIHRFQSEHFHTYNLLYFIPVK